MRTRNGCRTHSKEPRIVIDGMGFHSCLCNFQNPKFYTYLLLAEKLDQGILPDKGALLDQPAALLEALQLLARLKAEATQAEHKKQAAEVKRNGRK